jgi:hypothetical protein
MLMSILLDTAMFVPIDLLSNSCDARLLSKTEYENWVVSVGNNV